MTRAFSAIEKIFAEFTIPEVMRVRSFTTYLIWKGSPATVTSVVAIFAAFCLEAQDLNKHDYRLKVYMAHLEGFGRRKFQGAAGRNQVCQC